MNKDNWITILSLTLGSGVVTALIQWFQNRRKSGVETHNLSISGEISIGDAWRKYAEQAQKDMNLLRADFEQLQRNFNALKSEKEELATATAKKDRIIIDLQNRVVALEKELSIYTKK